jgi:isopenicillin-N N-acyltransferase-like protein
MSELRVVVTEGDPATRGRAAGRALGEVVERSLEFYHRYLERRGVASRELQDLLTPYLWAAENEAPDLMAYLKAMAEGAMVPVMELFAVNAFEELEPLLQPEDGRPLFLRSKERRVERCSTVTAVGPGYTLLGHNEHWLAGDTGNIVVLIERPDRGTPVASPTVVCCLPAVGTNGAGGVQGIGSLTASDERPGVPRVLVSRQSLGARDRAEAVRQATIPGRAGGYGHVFAFPGGDTFVVETTATRHSVLDGPGPHTNHYVSPDLGELAPEPSDSSRGRYRRLQQLLEERRPSTPEDLMSMMADHEGENQAICLHPMEGEGDEASAVLFGMVCDLEAGRMWVSPGNPCETIYEEIDLGGVLEGHD